MKKTISFLLILIMLCTMSIPAFAVDNTSSTTLEMSADVQDFLTTNEESMPLLDASDVQSLSGSTSTLNTSTRSAWVAETEVILEESYAQEVSAVFETTDYIVFTFDAPETIIENVGYVDKVEYVKPESVNASSTYQTKIAYMYGWLDGYYPLEEQTGKWSAIKDVLLTVAGFAEKLTIYTTAITVMEIAADYFKGPETVKASNTTQYYVLNKIGQIKSTLTGMWEPWAYVGSRRCFYRTLIEEEVGTTNYWRTVGVEETIPNSLTNPTNADKTDKKLYFDNNSMIIKKAIEGYTYDRAYMDVYGWTTQFSDTIPN